VVGGEIHRDTDDPLIDSDLFDPLRLDQIQTGVRWTDGQTDRCLALNCSYLHWES